MSEFLEEFPDYDMWGKDPIDINAVTSLKRKSSEEPRPTQPLKAIAKLNIGSRATYPKTTKSQAPGKINKDLSLLSSNLRILKQGQFDSVQQGPGDLYLGSGTTIVRGCDKEVRYFRHLTEKQRKHMRSVRNKAVGINYEKWPKPAKSLLANSQPVVIHDGPLLTSGKSALSSEVFIRGAVPEASNRQFFFPSGALYPTFGHVRRDANIRLSGESRQRPRSPPKRYPTPLLHPHARAPSEPLTPHQQTEPNFDSSFAATDKSLPSSPECAGNGDATVVAPPEKDEGSPQVAQQVEVDTKPKKTVKLPETANVRQQQLPTSLGAFPIYQTSVRSPKTPLATASLMSFHQQNLPRVPLAKRPSTVSIGNQRASNQSGYDQLMSNFRTAPVTRRGPSANLRTASSSVSRRSFIKQPKCETARLSYSRGLGSSRGLPSCARRGGARTYHHFDQKSLSSLAAQAMAGRRDLELLRAAPVMKWKSETSNSFTSMIGDAAIEFDPAPFTWDV